jgi:hypothetical protein
MARLARVVIPDYPHHVTRRGRLLNLMVGARDGAPFLFRQRTAHSAKTLLFD